MLNIFEIVNWLRVKNYYDLKNGTTKNHLTQLRTMKLLYYMQAASLVIRNKPLFSNSIMAWKLGPVIPEIHSRYIHHREIVGTITKKDKIDFEEIQNNYPVVSLLNKICLTYVHTKDYQLVNKTHSEIPWQSAKQSTEIKIANMKKAYQNEFNDEDWNLIKILNNSDPNSLAYTVAKEKLEDKGLIPNSVHDVQNEDDFWKQFE